MALDVFILRAEIAVAVVLLITGAIAAWASANVAKRVVGLLLAHIGAVLGLAVLGLPNVVLLVGAGVALAHLLIGAALLVRLQEAYGGIEAREFDAADDQTEPTEPTP
jgi:hypothetical protein